jgi:hypothetical protein
LNGNLTLLDEDYFYQPAGSANNRFVPGGAVGQPNAFCAKPYRHIKRFGVEWDGSVNLVWVFRSPSTSTASIHPLKACAKSSTGKRFTQDLSDVGGNFARLNKLLTSFDDIRQATVVTLTQPSTVFTGVTPQCAALHVVAYTSKSVGFQLTAGTASYSGETTTEKPGPYGFASFESTFPVPVGADTWTLTATNADSETSAAFSYVKATCVERYDSLQGSSSSVAVSMLVVLLGLVAALFF